jgi:hypothetical protein
VPDLKYSSSGDGYVTKVRVEKNSESSETNPEDNNVHPLPFQSQENYQKQA